MPSLSSSSRMSSSLPLILAEIQTQLQALLTVLQEEYLALGKEDAETLASLAQQKTDITHEIEALEATRSKLLQDAGLDLNRTGILDYLSRNPAKSGNKLAYYWNQIEELTLQCREQNIINGHVIESNRQRLQTALKILKGQTGNNELYSAEGNTVNTESGQTLAKA